MICQDCTRQAEPHGRRCPKCQRQAVLTACQWTEQQAQQQITRGLAELRHRGRNRLIREGLHA